MSANLQTLVQKFNSKGSVCHSICLPIGLSRHILSLFHQTAGSGTECETILTGRSLCILLDLSSDKTLIDAVVSCGPFDWMFPWSVCCKDHALIGSSRRKSLTIKNSLERRSKRLKEEKIPDPYHSRYVVCPCTVFR